MNQSSVTSSSSSNSTSGESMSPYISSVLIAISIAYVLPANIYIICIIVKKGLQNELFYFSLSLNEIICSFGSVMYLLSFHFAFIELTKPGLFLGGFHIAGRPLLQFCICMERYVAVVHPIIFLKYKHLRYKLMFSSVVWIIILNYALLLSVSSDSSWTDTLNYLLLGQYMVVCLLKIFGCLMVLMTLKQTGPSEGKKNRTFIEKSKAKSFRIILLIMIYAILNYIPMALSLVYFSVSDTVKFAIAWSISLHVVITAEFAQPLFFLFRYASVPFVGICK